MRGKVGDGETKSAGRELDGRARVLLLRHIYNREPQYSSSDEDILHPSPPVLPSFGSFPAHASDPRPLLRRDPFESPITSNNGAHTRRPDLVLLIPTSQCFISLLGLVLVPLLLQSSIFPWRVRCVPACPINPLRPNHQLFQRQARCRRGGKGRQIRQWCSGATLILERHRTRSRERKWYVLHKGV